MSLIKNIVKFFALIFFLFVMFVLFMKSKGKSEKVEDRDVLGIQKLVD